MADPCQFPEYHLAYKTRFPDAKPILWVYEFEEQKFAYPFFVSPIVLKGSDQNIQTEYFDISSTYGYSGPLSTTIAPEFLKKAWLNFDGWASKQNIVAEFTRFNLFSNSVDLAHKNTTVEENREVAFSLLPKDKYNYFNSLHTKTKNMIRKSINAGAVVKRLSLESVFDQFVELYTSTMKLNNANEFFFYTEDYFRSLTALPEDEALAFCIFKGDKLESSIVVLRSRDVGLYHLGASSGENKQVGIRNLLLFDAACWLIEKNVTYFNLGGGRTTANDDSLLRFKVKNALSSKQYAIGKRLINKKAYENLTHQWLGLNNQQQQPPPDRILFYRN